MKIITDTEALKAFCEVLKKGDFITIDTEFLREKTYYSKLCLIQIANDEDEAIIDPLARDIDLEPLKEILFAENIIKVFHAARQDLEIFFHMYQKVPTPLFDTQVAAMVAGFGESVGYERLVRDVLKVQIDKSSRFTDWSKRPLSNKQLKYALADVTHLIKIYKHLNNELEKTGRASWLKHEMAILENSETYDIQAEDVWKKIKFRNLKKQHLGPLMLLAKWREEEARSSNIPKNRILKDDQIIELATQQPKKIEELEGLRSIQKGWYRSDRGKAAFDAMQTGMQIPLDDLPELKTHKPPKRADSSLLEMLKVVLRLVCEKENVAAKLIANSADLEKIALDDDANVPALKGWRRELFGNAALDVKHGRSGLKIENGRVQLFRIK